MKAFVISALLCAAPALAVAENVKRSVFDQSSDQGSGLSARMVALPGRAPATDYALGDRIAICVEAERTGFITIWAKSPNQIEPVRLYPNKHMQNGTFNRGAPIRAGGEVCIGENDQFDLVIQEPLGEGEVYVHWTPSQDEQFNEEDIPVISERSLTRSTSKVGYDSQTIRYMTRP